MQPLRKTVNWSLTRTSGGLKCIKNTENSLIYLTLPGKITFKYHERKSSLTPPIMYEIDKISYLDSFSFEKYLDNLMKLQAIIICQPNIISRNTYPVCAY